ncbi:MAG: histidine phosphatase family protein [Solirubrobacteraceae bacterium]
MTRSALSMLSAAPPPAHYGHNEPCRIYLVRHGRTLLNAEIRFRGRFEVPLDDHGRAEAWTAARSLSGAGLSAVYTSPLGRAREVARAVCVETGVDGHQELPGLLNLHYGRWTGLTKQEAAERDPEQWWLYRHAPELADCPGGEKLAHAADRITESLHAIADRHPGQAVAAITHGVMIRLAVLRSQRHRSQDWQIADWEIPLPTGSAVVFEASQRGLSVAQLPSPATTRHTAAA